MEDLGGAQAMLDEKQAELDKVQAVYDNAMKHKQVEIYLCSSITIDV